MNVMNVAIGQLNYRCNLKSVNIGDGVNSLQSSSSLQTLPEVGKVLNYSSCLFLFLFFIFYRMITAPGLLAFLQASFFLFLNFT